MFAFLRKRYNSNLSPGKDTIPILLIKSLNLETFVHNTYFLNYEYEIMNYEITKSVGDLIQVKANMIKENYNSIMQRYAIPSGLRMIGKNDLPTRQRFKTLF